MAHLEEIPEEMLLLIVDQLANDCENLQLEGKQQRLHDLYNLALTSRRLNQIATPYLYSSYSYRMGNEYPIARILHSRPDLATHMKCLHWTYKTYEDPAEPILYPDEEEERILHDSDLLRMMRKKQPPDENLLRSMIMQLLNIHVLEVDCTASTNQSSHPVFLQPLRKAAFGDIATLEHTFDKLHTMELSMSGSISLEFFSPILRLPSLRTLILRQLLEVRKLANWDCPARTSTIESLYLERCFIDYEAIIQLLASCQQLSHFSCSLDTDPWSIQYPNVRAPHKNWPAIAESLRMHKDFLKSLALTNHLDPEHDLPPHPDTPSDSHSGWLGDLHDFPKLTSLDIGFDALVRGTFAEGYQAMDLPTILPPSLEYLSVVFDTSENEYLKSQLDSLAESSEAYLPNLKEVKVEYGYLSTLDPDYMGRIETIFAIRGIKFQEKMIVRVHNLSSEFD